MSGYSLANIMKMDETDPEQMDAAAEKIRAKLTDYGVNTGVDA